jgi:hypothetical protein
VILACCFGAFDLPPPTPHHHHHETSCLPARLAALVADSLAAALIEALETRSEALARVLGHSEVLAQVPGA